jgi:hypothetical protein
MANVKISDLTAATTPLAGTEVLPIVQSGTTVKVSAANLTAGRAVSASSLTLSGGTANGVAYLNGSKVVTTGSALQFDGVYLCVGGAASGNGLLELNAPSGNNTNLSFYENGSSRWVIGSVTSSNAFRFYNLASTSEAARIDSSNNLLVGTTTATSAGRISVTTAVDGNGVGINSLKNLSSNYYMLVFKANGSSVGEIYSNGSTTTYATSSDYRLKDNIQPMMGALAKVAALKPVTYKWKNTGLDGQGFIAHELQEIVPDCVGGAKDEVDSNGRPKYQSIDTSFLVATLTAAIQELKAEFDAYKASHP